MTVDNDSLWLDALAGRIDAATSASDAVDEGIDAVQLRGLVLEAVALRELIRSQEFDLGPLVLGVDAEREATLIERARREGLIALAPALSSETGQTSPTGHTSHTSQARLTKLTPARRTWFGASRLGLAAAALVIIAVGAGIWQSLLPPTETLRGVEHGTVLLTARDPQSLKRQLVEELQGAGVKVSSYERLGRAGIDADLPQPLSSALVGVLERHHIPIPSDGVLVVEIEGPDRP